MLFYMLLSLRDRDVHRSGTLFSSPHRSHKLQSIELLDFGPFKVFLKFWSADYWWSARSALVVLNVFSDFQIRQIKLNSNELRITWNS